MGFLSSANSLSELSLFAGLPETTLDSIGKRLERRSFRKGTALLMAGENSGIVFIVQSGLVRIVTSNRSGENVLLGLLGPGEIIGEISALDNLAHSADVVADEDCICWCLPADALHEYLRLFPEMAINLLCMTVKRVRNTTERITMLSTQDCTGRVAQQLLIFAHQCGVDLPNGVIEIPLSVTQGDIAALTGVSRQSVNAAFKQLRAINAVSCNKTGHYMIHKPELLAHRCR